MSTTPNIFNMLIVDDPTQNIRIVSHILRVDNEQRIRSTEKETPGTCPAIGEGSQSDENGGIV
ncbi:MAG: hypothetical protein GY801_01795 [bacterium]|nr:hypothetical protein [bacterium]